MDREVVLLQQLRRGLTGWLDVIRRATGAKEVHVALDKLEGVSIVGVWQSESTGRVEYKKTFTPQMLFGHTLELTPGARQLVRRPCDCAREYIRENLQQRGIIS